MNTADKITEVLNDLVLINNDRIVGYEKAIDELKDSSSDLQAIFRGFIDVSRRNVAQLIEKIHQVGGDSKTGTTNSGKLYRAWMDVKATFTSNDRLTVLESCEFGEDAAQKAYKDALSSDPDIVAEIRELISTQKAALKEGHDTVKRYRDMNKDSK